MPKIVCINVPDVGMSGESVNVGHPDKKAIPEHNFKGKFNLYILSE